ncbi:cobalt ECF transporter T component CbiQ [Pelotomaculum terephthalicicum JT]|uniref:cobalt ECF transporter T component CbiQ n=1 Tax=Pelotomaculum TaxID=191373 RepID=UPI0009D00008|nr:MULTISPECIES: cobalt ECF transporter T component CbiQ [Pelotomaculum]MCG9969184.1 cobalt ECF transporter T component CbiQ [Pelotomaculum terephthalicicum JT]OPX89952.1 MAG: Energy-coupling factor transporter transmembrane protein EcfT [Pelotomaculum sp. PtaB.Bin117]
MSNITDSIYKMRFLDETADKRTPVHDLHPLSKLLVTIAYVTVVVSYGKYDVSKLLPLVFYPVVILFSAEIPLLPLLKRTLAVMPLVIGIGVFNPVFDRETIAVIFGLPISGGWISFISLLLKCVLTVLSALLLVATTGMERISFALRMLFVPRIFVMQLMLTYRFISVLLEEAANIWNSYTLRAPRQKGISHQVWGPLLGQMLMRTYDRAQRVYQAMVLRGFNGEYNTGSAKQLLLKDFLYLASWVAFFAAARHYNIPLFIGSILTGVGK